VLDLAQAHRIASAAFSDPNAIVGTGTLTIGVGADSFDVVIDSSKQTLAGIRDAINSSENNTGVMASIINVDGGSRLVLTARDGGTANTLTVSGLSALSFTEVDAAKDAVLEVDGFQVTRASNTIADVLSGVTLQLKGQGDADLSIVADTESYTKAAQELVDAYNALSDTIESLRQGPLRGDTLMLRLDSKLRQAFSSPVAGLTADFSYAVELGLSFDRNGVLSLNQTKLESAMATDFDSVVALFGRENDGLLARLNSVLNTYTGSGGLIDNRNQGLDGQIRSLDQRIDSYEYRLTLIEERYRRQFSALDGLLGQLQGTSSFLSQQLANLPFNQRNRT
jgi:flagellar hook-associated protein 2